MCFLKDMLSHLFKLLYMLHHGAAEHSEKAPNPLSAYLSSMTPTIAWRRSDWQVRIPLRSLLSEPCDLSHVICCPAVCVLWTSISSDLCVSSTVVVTVIPVHHRSLFFDFFPRLSLNSLLMKNKWKNKIFRVWPECRNLKKGSARISKQHRWMKEKTLRHYLKNRSSLLSLLFL